MGQQLCPGIFLPSSGIMSCTYAGGKGAMACPLQGFVLPRPGQGLLLPEQNAVDR